MTKININSEEIKSQLEYYNKVLCEFNGNDIDNRMTLLEKMFIGFSNNLLNLIYEQNTYTIELENKIKKETKWAE